VRPVLLSYPSDLSLDANYNLLGSVNHVGRSKAVSSSSPRDVLVDYVRVYQTKTIAASLCDRVTPPQRALAFLDVLHLS
jgi:hypothetical protein